ncbi:MAG: DNA-3-methyladenine glycosylase I [Fimbriimonadaceae bacterium]|nr:DNA-3-methyladenine glycosylase I [Fimbriimonadaceae bacterium]QYK55982.1 MAG: DNA-3-methyladenine glycosylase I [Fimbriimonadaceae bacterium]
MPRCAWAEGSEVYQRYHDEEWGVPVLDDRVLFEFLILEGAQAGLSWSTILNRRAGYRRAYQGFDPQVVARYTEADQQRLLSDEGIIRNRAKVASSVNNAIAFLRVVEEFGSFSNYQWRFVDGRPIQNTWKSLDEVPAVTKEAEEFSKDLKKRGFNFVGPTIMYAHMQAVGMVNDHLVDCPRHRHCRELASTLPGN